MSAPATPGNKLDSVRQHNLSTVIGIVHRYGPQSRSALTRTTGLNRSTIGALVGELVELGLVTERLPTTTDRVGRPSPVVAARPLVLGAAVNPDVDAVTVGLVGLDGTVHSRVRCPTDEPPTAERAARIAASALTRLCSALPGAPRPVAVGAAVPGQVRTSDGVVRLAPHLGWVDAPFGSLLARATGLPVRVANDASVGANAERLFGAGRGVDDLVYLYGGAAGIGGGVVTRGELLLGAAGYAGELGHTLVNSAGRQCRCGSSGCLETEVRQDELVELLGLRAADMAQVADALADSTDPTVRAAVDRQLGYLAVALCNAVNICNPRLVVLGGFLALLHTSSPGRLERLVRAGSLAAPAENLEVVAAQLGADLLMVGGAELAFEPLLADPATLGA